MAYRVMVKINGERTHHGTFSSYRDAVDQADMVRGEVFCENGISDKDAWKHAKAEQGFIGSFAEWQGMDDEERAEFEGGASGSGTV